MKLNIVIKEINNINGLYAYFYYYDILNNYLTSDDKDHMLAKAFEKLLKTHASWSVDMIYSNRIIFAGFNASESKDGFLRIYNVAKIISHILNCMLIVLYFSIKLKQVCVMRYTLTILIILNIFIINLDLPGLTVDMMLKVN
jgi:hypothetical protein